VVLLDGLDAGTYILRLLDRIGPSVKVVKE
jgi:hypothetical protein